MNIVIYLAKITIFFRGVERKNERKKIIAIAAAFAITLGIVTGFPTNTENAPNLAITAEAANSKESGSAEAESEAPISNCYLIFYTPKGGDASFVINI